MPRVLQTSISQSQPSPSFMTSASLTISSSITPETELISSQQSTFMRRVTTTPHLHSIPSSVPLKLYLDAHHEHRTRNLSTIVVDEDDDGRIQPSVHHDYLIAGKMAKTENPPRNRVGSHTTAQSDLSSESSDEDDYAWYFRNPHRYIWRPRNLRARITKRNSVLRGAGAGEQEAANRSLFAAYLGRHYGSSRLSAIYLESGTLMEGTCDGGIMDWYDANRSDVGALGSDASTVFSLLNDWDVPCSPTLANESLRTSKRSSDWPRSSIDTAFVSSTRCGTASPFPSLSTHDEKDLSSDNKYHIPLTNSITKDGKRMSSFFRPNSNRVRGGVSHRFSLLRIFSP